MTIWKPHVTVAAIAEKDNKFLIVEEQVGGELVFNQPAGHLDCGESLIAAVIRETLEESAWRFQPEALVGIRIWRHPRHGESYLRFSFCGRCHDHDASRPLDKGIKQVLWLSRDQLLANQEKLRSPLVLSSIDDYQAGKRHSLEILDHVAPDFGL